MSDTTSELRQLFEKTDGYAVELQKNGEPYNPDMYYLYQDVLALLAAQRQQWEVAARIDELKLMNVHMNPNFNQTGKLMARIDTVQAALDGERGKEQ